MKKFFLLIVFFVSCSAYAQTGRHNPDSLLRAQHIQDSIRDQELLDILTPLEQKYSQEDLFLPQPLEIDTAPPVVPPLIFTDEPQNPETKVSPTETLSAEPARVEKEAPVQAPDTLKQKAASDSLLPVTTPPDTLQPEIPAPPTSTIDPRSMPLDSLSPELLLLYYQTEPEPIDYYKGPDTGDSIYYELRPLVVPTTTVEGVPLYWRESAFDRREDIWDSVSYAEQRLKPKISLGMGRMGFHGDLYNRHFQNVATGRPGFDLAVSHRMTRYLQADFSVLFGKLGGNERLGHRNENFSSEIRAGGLNFLYDFGNFIPSHYKVRPFVSLGAFGFEFLSKTDLKDRNGNTYHYWSDGSIKDRPEGSPEAQLAVELQRDYIYETDIRELNRDGFGKYPERAFAFPVGAGVIMKVTDRVDLKLNFQYFLSTTDYIDGITNQSVGNRIGTKRNDNWTYASFSLQYDLIAKKRPQTSKHLDTLTKDFWFAFDQNDEDEDGVMDRQDECLGTAKGAPVDARGCPLDDDGDGIPNYRDDELATAPGIPVNARGVGQSDTYWQNWYDNYLNDTLATDKTTETVGNIYAVVPKKPKEKKDNFTVELVRYAGPIPSDELAFLLSIGDINSVTLDDGTTVVYTSGNYDKLSSAIKRRDEFRTTGNKAAGISRIQGREIIQVGDEELQKLLESEIEDLLNISIGDSLGTESVLPEEIGMFGKNDIVYRVQLGAYRNKISTKVFNTSAGVLELKTGENVYRYVTKGYRTIEEAASTRADLVVQGYSDAFVTAYKDGKRIPMSQTGATLDKGYKEDLNENKTFNSIDKKLLVFKIQLGPLKKPAQEAAMDENVKDLQNIEKQTTATGNIRYTAGGDFSGLDAAEKLRKELEEKGYTDAFIIATFKNEIISIQEAMELLK